MSVLNETIKRILNRKNMSQKDLALKLGISNSYMSDLLLGRRSWTYWRLSEVEKILSVARIDLQLMLARETVPDHVLEALKLEAKQ